MRKLVLATILVLGAAGIAVYDLLSGWLIAAGGVANVVVFSASSLLLFVPYGRRLVRAINATEAGQTQLAD